MATYRILNPQLICN